MAPDTAACNCDPDTYEPHAPWCAIGQPATAALDPDALTAAHLAVEDVLIELRDGCIGVIGPANGFIVNDRDGTRSPIMRLGTRAGLDIGIKAYLAALEARNGT